MDPKPVEPAVHPITLLDVETPMDAETAGSLETRPVAGPDPDSVVRTGRSRVRWLIGGGVAAAALAALALGVVLLGARPLPEALGYLPMDSVVVLELRPELPGDQRQRLGNFLAHFPGFADQSILEQKLDEVLDRLVRAATSGAGDYANQVKPLLAGPMVMSLGRDGLARAMNGEGPAGYLLVATTDGTVTCDALFGVTTGGGTHRGVDLRAVTPGFACAVQGRFVLLGDAAAVRAAVDARLDGRGIDGSSTYRAARATLDGDQLAILYADGAALRDLLGNVAQSLGQSMAGVAVAPWAIAGLRVVDDAVVVDTHAPAPTAPLLPSGAPTLAPADESRVAGALPADTLGYVEIHGVGALAQRGLAAMRADPAQADALAQVDAALAMLGGADNLVGWVEEVGLAVIPTEDAVGGALLIRGTDADAVAARVAQVRNLLVLAATGTDITVRDSEYDGITVTSVDLGNLSTLLGGLGGPGGLDGIGTAGDARLRFAIAVRGDLVVIGLGDGVVERILDVRSGSALESAASYGRATQLAGSRNDAQLFIAVDAVLAVVEGLGPPDALEAWNTEIRPYAEHLAAAALAATRTGATNDAKFVLTVK